MNRKRIPNRYGWCIARTPIKAAPRFIVDDVVASLADLAQPKKKADELWEEEADQEEEEEEWRLNVLSGRRREQGFSECSFVNFNSLSMSCPHRRRRRPPSSSVPLKWLPSSPNGKRRRVLLPEPRKSLFPDQRWRTFSLSLSLSPVPRLIGLQLAIFDNDPSHSTAR